MSYLVLARKYRPQTFEQVIGQAHVTQTLANAISSDRVAHAILFSGPRGTGKTTVARILAKAINCKNGPLPVPCNSCRSCKEITASGAVDVYEIDGASNNSVDQIRDLRENVKYMPAHSRYKIYIIDEVHMLSNAAFNALLKTLEEPPPHVMFIFATTEPQKMPITILSRCQRHDFKRIELKCISEHLEFICRQEKMKMPSESLWMIARESEGSMRDALSLLDQVMLCSDNEVGHDQILDLLGIIDRKILFDFTTAILTADVSQLLYLLDLVYDQGHDMKKLYRDLLLHFRDLLVVKLGKSVQKLVDIPAHEIKLMDEQLNPHSASSISQFLDILFKEEAAVKFSSHPKLALEMIFIRMFEIKPALPIDTLIDKLDALNPDSEDATRHQIAETKSTYTTSTGGVKNQAPGAGERPTESHEPKAGAEPKEHKGSGRMAHTDPDSVWAEIFQLISNAQPSLAASIKESRLKNISETGLEIEINGNDFNLKMVMRDKNLSLIQEICDQYFGRKLKINIIPKKIKNDIKKNDNQLKNKALTHPLVSDTLEILGGKIIAVKTV